MRNHTTRKLYLLHSWLGALTAVLLFVVAFSGAVAVFGAPELKIWSSPVIHQYDDGEIDSRAIERLMKEHAAALGPDYLRSIGVIFPGNRRKENLVLTFEADIQTESGRTRKHVIHFEHHPKTLELVRRIEGSPGEIYEQRHRDLSDFVINFHADLHLGEPWGLIVTGVLGLTLFASIATGVAIHRKILRELFTFRPLRSLRLLWTDSHKVLGVWGLLFHSVIAFSGAYLGFAAVTLVPAAAFVSFAGDRQALVEAVLPDIEPELSGENGALNFAGVLDTVRASDAGKLVSMSLVGWRDSNAIVIANTLPGRGMVPTMLEYRAATAQHTASHTTYGRTGGFSGTVLDLMRPLHFGHFGGVLVKGLWAVLGIGTSLLAFSGMMIWIERRAYGPEGKLSVAQYHLIGRISIGLCMGLVVGFISLFYAQRLFADWPESLGFWLGAFFFGSWSLAALWAALRDNEYRAARELTGAAALLCLGVPLVSGMATGHHLLNALTGKHYTVAAIDLFLFSTGSLLSYLTYRLPDARPQRSRRAQREQWQLGIQKAGDLP